MPSIADIPYSPTTSKKRRREDLDSSSYDPHIHNDELDPQFRHILPAPYSKKSRSLDTGIKRQRIDIAPAQSPAHHDEECFTRPPLSDVTDRQSEMALSPSSSKKLPRIVDLSPCHICHRKPTERKHLDAFTDCEGCGEKTCYVCVRECEGWSMVVEGKEKPGPWEKGNVESHRRMVCSRCCVERGSDGEVWCLGCLRMGEGG